jgi:PAS domain S-box-containing protein
MITQKGRSKRRTHSGQERRKRFPTHYRVIFDNAGDAIFIHDMGGRFLEVNRTACVRLGYTRRELLRMSPVDIDYPSSPDLVKKRVDEVRSRGHVFAETAHIRRDGTIFPVELSSRMIDYGGKPAVLSIARDITERGYAEEANSRLVAIVESSDDAIISKTLDGTITSWNQGAERLYGYSAKEANGRPISILVPPGRPNDVEQLLKAVQRGKRTQHYETERVRKDGKTVKVSLGISPIRDATGRVVGASTIAHDITGHKQTEEALRVSEMKYRTLFENIPLGIYQTSPEGKLLTANPALVRLLGYNSETELLAVNVDRNMYTNAEDRKRWMGQLETHGEVRDAELVLKRKDGRELTVLDNAHLFRDDQGVVQYYEGSLADISERKQAEEALRESEERFREAMEATSDGLWDWNVGTGEAYYSPAYYRMLGYEPDEFPGIAQSWMNLIHAEDREQVSRANQDCIENRTPNFAIEFRMKTRSDGWKWILGRGHAGARDANGRALRMIGTHQDITERKQMEEALRQYSERLQELVAERTAKLQESEERFRGIAERSFDAIFTTDIGGNITYTSSAAKSALGYLPEELLGKRIQDYLTADEIPRLRQAFTTAKNGESVGGLEAKARRKDGSTAYTEINISPVIKDGKVVGIQGIARDITERRRAEEEIRASRKRLEYVITSNPAVIFTAKPRADLSDYEVTYMSNRVLEMLGFEPRHFVDHPEFWEGRVHPEDLHRYPMEVSALWNEGRHAFEYRFLHKDGTYRWIREEAEVIRDPDGKPTEVMGYWTDVTERKQMEDKLVKAERLSAIGETVMMVGHDLRNPLQVLMNSVALWEEICTSMPPEQKQLSYESSVNRLLERIERQLEYMNKIVSDLQDYARPIKPELIGVDVLSFAKETLSTIPIPKNIEVSVKPGSDATLVMLDPAMMKRVLTNLITNAIQAMPNGGALKIGMSTTKDTVSIEVADTGVGISEENLAKIFQPLFTTKSKGQGLGLPVCKRLVEGHGGSIEVKSKVGEGTTFTIDLPLKSDGD